MKVFRPTRRGKSGASVEYQCWYLRFCDHSGRERKLKGFSDKSATIALGRRVEKLIDLRKSETQPDAEMLSWLERIDKGLRERLLEIGLVKGEAANRSRKLVCSKCDSTRVIAGSKEPCRCSEHVSAYLDYMRGKKSTERHIQQTLRRLKRIIRECGFVHYGDINGDAVETFLSGMLSDEHGGGTRTRNFHLTVINGFCRWMIRSRRASANPVVHVEMLRVSDEDLRHGRRAFTPEELSRLLQATRNGPVRWQITGLNRSMLYKTALETGFRRGELACLRIGDFDLEADPPTVTLAAKHTKNSDTAVLPLRPDFVTELRKWFSTLGGDPSRKCWPYLPKSTAKILRHDLKLAGIPYQDEAGKFRDFHSLRHSYISALARSTASPKTVQTLARHRSFRQTFDAYAHIGLHDQSKAIVNLPDLPTVFDSPDQTTAKATGTFDSVPVSVPDSGSGSIVNRGEKTTKQQDHNSATIPFKPRKTQRKAADHPGKTGSKSSPEQKTPEAESPVRPSVNSDDEPVVDKGVTQTVYPQVPVSVPDSAQNVPSGVDLAAVWSQLPEELRKAILAAVDERE